MLISTVRFEAFEKEFAKLVKFAAKVNAEAPTYTAEMIYDKKRGFVYQVEVSGVAPKYADWEFVARIDNVEKVITGLKPFPLHYYDDHGKCEHCNVNHRRVKTYIIQKESEFMEVGGACLKQYIGGISPADIARHFDLLKAVNDFDYDFDSSERGYGFDCHNDLPRFISLVKSFKDKFGYTKASEEGQSTAETVYRFMTHSLPREEQVYYAEISQGWSTQHQEYAIDAITYVMSLERANSFMINLQQICKNGFFTQRTYKILAAIVQVYDAYVLGQQQRKNDSLVSEYVGNEKDKVSRTATIIRKRVTFDAYNMQTWLLMKDNEGNVLSWNASKELEDLYEGDEIEITGTVKTHKLYNDVKQTVLTRCKYQKK